MRMVTQVGRIRLFNATTVTAVIAAAALALSACGSSGNGGGSSPTTAPAGGGDTTATSPAAGGGGGATSPAGGGGSSTCEPGNLTASGSTAQQNAINAWIKAYTAQCSGANITYAGGGSGQGISDFTSGKVDFAGSDAALDPTAGETAAATKQCGSPALDLPMVTGPVAVAFNVNGISNGGLVLTPKLIAEIFVGKITKWNDPALQAANHGVQLPDANITVFFRSDESGTTQNFETYLADSAPKDFVKGGKTIEPSKDWAGTGQGKSGSQGVQQAIQSTQNSIGYIEWSYAGSANLAMAKVDNGGGPVALTAETAGKAVAAAQVASQGHGDLTLKLDYATKVAGAYPIILVTYEIVCSTYKNAAQGARVKAFLTFTSSAAGQHMLPSVGSAPLPSQVLTKVQAAVAKIS